MAVTYSGSISTSVFSAAHLADSNIPTTAVVDSCKTRIKKCIYNFMTRLSTSTNLIVHYYSTSGQH